MFIGHFMVFVFSEEDWTKKDGRTMGILRNDDEDTPPEDQSASQ